jgi:hypothetical protein
MAEEAGVAATDLVDPLPEDEAAAAEDTRVLSREKRLLACQFSDAEVLDLARELGRTLADIQTEHAKQASVKRELQARMAQLEAKATELAEKVRRGEEMRDVEVMVVLDYTEGRVDTFRTDTGQTIHTRPLTNEERQQRLEL